MDQTALSDRDNTNWPVGELVRHTRASNGGAFAAIKRSTSPR
jgi:hypothetical protein